MPHTLGLISWLFETDAIRVCEKDRPFWYTSGTIGPYYINTHFLYGNEDKANELLKIIDTWKEDKAILPRKLLALVKQNYNTDDIFKNVIDEIKEFILLNLELDKIDYISGGERRDWFFSLILAEILKKPHLTIYKDLTVVLDDKILTTNIQNKNVLHIADLITEASSYERAWKPAIDKLSGVLKWSLAVVDRKQGGEEKLKELGIESFAMSNIDESLFKKALEQNKLDNDQYEMIIKYLKDPKGSMRDFLVKNPGYIEEALSKNSTVVQRARLCIDKNIYDL